MNPKMTPKEAELARENLRNLRQIYEMRKQLVECEELAPHRRIAVMREFNAAYDQYNAYLAEIIAKIDRVDGPEIEREQFRNRPPSKFREAA